MGKKEKLLTASLILLSGLGLALLFRHERIPSAAVTQVEPTLEQLPLRGDPKKVTFLSPLNNRPLPIETAPGEVVVPPRGGDESSLVDVPKATQVGPPPTIAEKYEKELFTVAMARPPVPKEVDVDEATPGMRQHRVADGDTLATLAGRFLGDSARWPEIFEANRHTLSDPYQLPIGVSLTIPPREAMNATWPAVRADRTPAMTMMVPVPRGLVSPPPLGP